MLQTVPVLQGQLWVSTHVHLGEWGLINSYTQIFEGVIFPWNCARLLFKSVYASKFNSCTLINFSFISLTKWCEISRIAGEVGSFCISRMD
jgi:hypothetical protein